ncbi:hypothetical protein N44_01764 [Microcystis aeruginosa NIES-44]|uniref:Uncharacterized protein n=1 Tax=Microcystis aeruginosa NIES-44 TaxID=449439 RepID=A0A0A1VTD5_MICAE|nr:hypothetical protein N44_01764 [Microcystis aeruginosa NIES-44]
MWSGLSCFYWCISYANFCYLLGEKGDQAIALFCIFQFTAVI